MPLLAVTLKGFDTNSASGTRTLNSEHAIYMRTIPGGTDILLRYNPTISRDSEYILTGTIATIATGLGMKAVAGVTSYDGMPQTSYTAYVNPALIVRLLDEGSGTKIIYKPRPRAKAIEIISSTARATLTTTLNT